MPDYQEAMMTPGTDGFHPGESRQDIERDVRRELQRCGYRDVRKLSCEYAQGVLTLRGRVPSYYLKQVAQTVVLGRLRGAAKLKNHVEVQSW